MSIVLKCNNGEIKISKKEIQSYEDFFLKNLLNDLDVDDNEIIDLDENTKIVRCVLNCLKYKKIIVSKKISKYEIFVLADKWCCPEWLITSLVDYYNQDFLIANLKDMLLNTFKCDLCGEGFKLSENHEKRCKFHPGKPSLAKGTWECCGQSYDTKGETKVTPCALGYHVCTYVENKLIKRLETFQILKKNLN